MKLAITGIAAAAVLTISAAPASAATTSPSGQEAPLPYCNLNLDTMVETCAPTEAELIQKTRAARCQMTGVSRTRATNWTAKVGVECARLFVNGTFRGEQCHSITA